MSFLEYTAVMVATALLIGLVVLLLVHVMRRSVQDAGHLVRNRDGSFPAICAVCNAGTLVSTDMLVTLSSAEKALVVRERPIALGKNLVEFVCPCCDAAHCYIANMKSMEFVGVNLYQGQSFQTRCKECQKQLLAPPWPAGAYDGNWREAPGPADDFGMVCSQCDAISCLACCTSTTRNRTADGSLLCPRCYRGPMLHFYHPAAAGATRN